jgi:hypothetical protein
MEEIDNHNDIALLGILLYLKENRNTDEKITRFLLELLVWNPYKIFTQTLVEKILPIIDTIDVKKLVWEM